MPGLLSTDWAKPGVPIPSSRLTGNLITYQYSATMRRVLLLEGPHEPWHALLFDVDPLIVEIVEQPLKIDARVLGRQLTYTFDLKILLMSGECFYLEFKAEDDLVEYESGIYAPKKWDLISHWCAENGVNPDFRTDRILKENRMYLQNWRRMVRSIQQFQKEERQDIAETVDNFMNLAQETTLSEILLHLKQFPPTQVQGYIFDAIRLGHYKCDLKKHILHMHTPIFREKA